MCIRLWFNEGPYVFYIGNISYCSLFIISEHLEINRYDLTNEILEQ